MEYNTHDLAGNRYGELAPTPKDSEPPTLNNASGSLHDIELMFLPFFNGEIQSEELIAELEAYIEQEKQKARVEELETLAELDYMALCPDCGGLGDDDNAHFWCSRCKAQGWINLNERVAELKGGTE